MKELNKFEFDCAIVGVQMTRYNNGGEDTYKVTIMPKDGGDDEVTTAVGDRFTTPEEIATQEYREYIKRNL